MSAQTLIAQTLWGGEPASLLQMFNNIAIYASDCVYSCAFASKSREWWCQNMDLCTDSVSQTIKQSTNQAINQSINQSTNQSITQPANTTHHQSINQTTSEWIYKLMNVYINEWVHESTNQSMNQWNNQSINESNKIKQYRGSCITYINRLLQSSGIETPDRNGQSYQHLQTLFALFYESNTERTNFLITLIWLTFV